LHKLEPRELGLAPANEIFEVLSQRRAMNL
jgi:hypothetical protein